MMDTTTEALAPPEQGLLSNAVHVFTLTIKTKSEADEATEVPVPEIEPMCDVDIPEQVLQDACTPVPDPVVDADDDL